MSRKWKFTDQSAAYFISYAVVGWIDVFIRNEYKEVLIESWQYCQRQKGLDIYAWVIMSSHVHLIIGTTAMKLEDIVRDMKRHTSEQLHSLISTHQGESRKEWMLALFKQAGILNSNNKEWQFWQQNNKPILIENQEMAFNILNYIHYNPVETGFVAEPQHWLYSSAIDYCGGKGLLEVKKIF